MDRDGVWRLAPAFDVVWAYNSKGTWTNRHQMTVNGKRDAFNRSDLLAVADTFGIKGAGAIVDRAVEAVAGWGTTAKECGVAPSLIMRIAATHRTALAVQ
jgi:serine/threonine-protein kinase HipA